MASEFEMFPGTSGVTLDDVTHLIIPGRGRSPDGMGLTEIATRRADVAGEFYSKHLLGKGGVIICTGYKSPADNTGVLAYSTDANKVLQGVPEGTSIRNRIAARYPEIWEPRIIAETRSIDTVTNFTEAQKRLPAFDTEAAVGIVANEEQLVRIMRVIAGRTLDRPYVGIIVPEIPDNPDTYPTGVFMASRYIAWGLWPGRPDSTEVAEERANRLYRMGAVASRARAHFTEPLKPGYELASESAKI